jgi:hypothetical protein
MGRNSAALFTKNQKGGGLFMARPKRTSRALTKAELRAVGMQSIAPTLDLGNGLTVEGFMEAVDSFRQDLRVYNTLLAQLDQVTALIKAKERDLSRLSERMLAAIVAKYGRDSLEYQAAGGTKRGDTLLVAPEALPEGISPMLSV